MAKKATRAGKANLLSATLRSPLSLMNALPGQVRLSARELPRPTPMVPPKRKGKKGK
jgi:hypothetical protein